MIITLEKISSLIDIPAGYSTSRLLYLLQSLETMVRTMTNNHFHVCNSFSAQVIASGNIVINGSHHLHIGDTIELVKDRFNKLCVITAIDGDTITVDISLSDFNDEEFDLYQVNYPDDVIMGVINLVEWEVKNRDKVGIKSESISRHSVSYYDLDTRCSNGYPQSLLTFLDNYRKARF